MTKPEHVRRWWGRLGEGYSVPVCEVDLRVGRHVALRQPPPEGRGRVPRRVPRDRAAGARGVHRDLRAVSRRRFGRDRRAHRRERQDAADRDVACIRRWRCATWCSRPAWRAAPPSATTGSRRSHRSSGKGRCNPQPSVGGFTRASFMKEAGIGERLFHWRNRRRVEPTYPLRFAQTPATHSDQH